MINGEVDKEGDDVQDVTTAGRDVSDTNAEQAASGTESTQGYTDFTDGVKITSTPTEKVQ